LTINHKKLNSFKKHIVVFCLLVLNIPFLIQGIHLFEDHDHNHNYVICTSDTEQHFHEIEHEDCSLFHYQFEIYPSDISIHFDIIPTHFFIDKHNEQSQITTIVHTSKKLSRGPPTA